MSSKSVLKLTDKSKDAIAFSQSKESKVLSEANDLKLTIKLDYIEAFSIREDFMKELTKFIEEKNEIIKCTDSLEDKEKKRKLEILNYKIGILNENLIKNQKHNDSIQHFVREKYSINNNHFIKEIFDAITKRNKQDADKTIQENLKKAIQLNKKIEQKAEQNKETNSIKKNKVKVLCVEDSECRNLNQKCEQFVCKEIKKFELEVDQLRSTKQYQNAYNKYADERRAQRRKRWYDPLN